MIRFSCSVYHDYFSHLDHPLVDAFDQGMGQARLNALRPPPCRFHDRFALVSQGFLLLDLHHRTWQGKAGEDRTTIN